MRTDRCLRCVLLGLVLLGAARGLAADPHPPQETTEPASSNANLPPVIEGLPTAVTALFNQPAVLRFTVTDADDPLEQLIVTTRVQRLDGRTLLDPTNAVITRDGTNGTLTLIPDPGAMGRARIMVTAQDLRGASVQVSLEYTATLFIAGPRALVSNPAVVDLNNDGRLDFYNAWREGSALQTIAGDYLGGFCSNTRLESLNNYRSVGDFDGDGWVDAIRVLDAVSVISRRDPGGVLFRNRGEWTDHPTDCRLTIMFTNFPTGYDAQLAPADVDNDGDLDLLFSGQFAGTVVSVPPPSRPLLYRNPGDGQFELWPPSLSLVSEPIAAWGDYDNDGDADLFLAGNVTNSPVPVSRLYRNEGDGRLVDTGTSLRGFQLGGAAWVDYDGDGDLDLAVTGSTNRVPSDPRPAARLYRNDSGSLIETAALTAGTSGGRLWWGDFDNDGRPDLLMNGRQRSAEPALFLWLQTIPGQFLLSQVPVRAFGASLEVGDFNRDGKLDYFAPGFDQTETLTRLNFSIRSNTPPTAPTNLRSELNQGIVMFRWDGATDADQTGGLTYNLRVGTAPGLDDLVVAMADPVTGTRRIVAPGNASVNTFWPWRRPRVGRLYWSVQSIDHGYASSPFASEQVIEVTELPPILAEERLREAASQSAILDGSLIPGTDGVAWWFEWGATPTYGESTPWQIIPAGDASVTVGAFLGGLESTTGYHFRLVVSNALGVARGPGLTFTTAPPVPAFEPLVSLLPQLGFASQEWADFDDDGDQDLAMGPATTNGPPTLFRNGAGLLRSEALNATLFRASVVRWIDYDADGDLDLSVHGTRLSGPLSVQRDWWVNDRGVLMARPATDGSLVLSQTEESWADFDHDGDLDSCRPFQFRRNLRRGQFGSWQPTGMPISPSIPADLNGDGELDLVTLGQSPTALYPGRANGGFQSRNPQLVQGITFRASLERDWNRDGAVDLLMAPGGSQPSAPRLSLNDGQGTFGPATPVDGVAGTPLAALDFDADGLLDLLTLEGTNIVFWSRSDGTHFTPVSRHGLGIPLGAGNLQVDVAAGDLDSDGRPDFAVAAGVFNRTNRFNRVFHNVTRTINPLPAAPPGLVATTGPTNDVTLRWDAATDANQAGGHTYNVRVGTQPGRRDVMSAAANGITGRLFLGGPGNAGFNRFSRLVDLYPGTYYWSVQAVDDSQAGSSWATESSFTISGDRVPSLTLDAVLGENLRVNLPLPGWVTIERSTTLDSWTPVATNYLRAPGAALDFAPPMESEAEFYRGTLEPY